MDWNAVIDRNRAALLGITAMLFAVAGIARGGVVEKLPRRVRSYILRSLRAAEAACRRLVIVQAREMTAPDRPRRPAPDHPVPQRREGAGRLPCFPLFDKRKRFAERHRSLRAQPRITLLDDLDPARPVPQPEPEPGPDDPMDARRLGQRLESLTRALENLPHQARRLLRVQAQRKHAPPGRSRVGPLRPGWPPGYRRRHTDPVDDVLYDCHVFALRVLNPPERRRPDRVST